MSTQKQSDQIPIYTKMGVRGQVMNPTRIRIEMGIAPGTRMSIKREGNTIVLQPITKAFIEHRHARSSYQFS